MAEKKVDRKNTSVKSSHALKPSWHGSVATTHVLTTILDPSFVKVLPEAEDQFGNIMQMQRGQNC